MQDVWRLILRSVTSVDVQTYDRLLDTLIGLRQAAGDSQRALADHLGVVQSTVGNWEARRSRVPADMMIAWAKKYGATLTVVADGDEIGALTAAAVGLDQDQRRDLAEIARCLALVDEGIREIVVALVRRSVSAERSTA